MSKSQIVRDTIRRFHHLPIRTIAQHILVTYGDMFDGDLEKIRSAVRYQMGRNGEQNRKNILEKSLFRTEEVKMPPTWRKNKSPYHLPHGTWLVLSDAHVPFHEALPLRSAIEAGKAESVTGIFLNGDWLDCAAVSYWPQQHRDFKREIELGIDSLDWLRSEFPDAIIVYKPGNHEYRLPRLFMAKAPELADTPIAAMENVMGFEERGIEFLDYHQMVMAGKLPIIHGHEVRAIDRSVNPARGLFLRTKTFSACSHCHTTSQHTSKNIHGDMLTTWSFGCLCDLQPDYNPFGNDWNWGFGIINIEKDENFEVINRRILNNGKVV